MKTKIKLAILSYEENKIVGINGNGMDTNAGQSLTSRHLFVT